MRHPTFAFTELLRDSDLQTSHRCVGFVLATYVNDRGECWPSLATLAQGAGCSESTVKRAIGAMLKAGLLREKKRRHNTSNVYAVAVRKEVQVTHDRGSPMTPTSEVQVTGDPSGQVTHDLLTDQKQIRPTHVKDSGPQEGGPPNNYNFTAGDLIEIIADEYYNGDVNRAVQDANLDTTDTHAWATHLAQIAEKHGG